jgi:glutamate dehydrogenase
VSDVPSSSGSTRHLPEGLDDRLERRIPQEELPLARAFADATLRRVPDETLRGADLDRLADVIAGAYRFLAEDPGDTIAIRTFVPGSTDGTSTVGTVLEVTTQDRPFLLSTIVSELRRRDLEVVRTIHPVVGVERNDRGRLRAIVPARHADRREALVHLEVDRRLGDEERHALERTLRSHLRDVVAATDDYEPMRGALEEAIAALAALEPGPEDARPETQPDEVTAFLRWILDDDLLILGTRRYVLEEHDGEPAIVAETGSGLGILRDTTSSRYVEPVPLSAADTAFRERLADDALLTVAPSHRLSTVHERERLLNLWIDERRDTTIVGQLRVIGLFTRKAQAEPSGTVPLLRAKLRRILEREDVVADSHDERMLVSLFEAVPKEESLAQGVAELRETLVRLFAASERGTVDVLVRPDPASGNVSVLVSVPRDRYDARLRRRVQDLLRQRYRATRVDVGLSLGDRPDAVARFAVQVPDGPIPDVPRDELEEAIRRLARTWMDDLAATLTARHGEVEGRRLLREHAGRLPRAYQEHTPVERAADELELLDTLENGLRITLRTEPSTGLLRVRILKRGPGIELSAILPVLESLGLTVVEELPFRLADEPAFHVHDYGTRAGGAPFDPETDGARFADAIDAAWHGQLEVDSLNRTVLFAGLDWRWVTVLRAYRRYRRQVGTVYTAEYQNDALANNPAAVRALVELFAARFDPDRATSDDDLRAARQRVLTACDAVERLDEDRILRDLLALIEATVRTNRYRDPRPSELALKIASGSVPRMPRPVPHREIFVYSPAVEGVHLRGGAVSRGGIRRSDRRDDFRTEVADLMQAQMLKNAVIVPDGAKGGYVIKRLPDGASDDGDAPREAYTRFISALLHVTDDIEDGEISTPAGVVRRDGDDPYLVVAPDRGTARFSDLANRIARDHGFWLDDAFASGGSTGYDHKQLGITARGAWVAVRRHFRELGVDVEAEPIRVVGIGDMSGDVFGNAMLSTPTIRLVAAFDHRDILIDPEPDAERTFTERHRLAQLPRSSWQDLDRSVLSEGGGVWSRADKRIALSEQVRQALRIDAEELAPPDLIRAILRAPVDLLFAGGIGTFVRATAEADGDIGDRVNDEIRVDGTQLRARVVGEGANLALTQRARIQYARRGGRVNADFVDNAAGVDISDREVNLKILLRQAVERGQLDPDDRDRVLAEATDEVVAACLDDVDRQTRVLSHETATSADRIEAHRALMEQLEHRGAVDREVDALPDAEEMRERAEAGAGLTRPELAVLLAAAKRDLTTRLGEADAVDAPELRSALRDYFPRPLTERFDHLLDEHRLRPQLIATEVANEVVDRMGITFVDRLARELGITEEEVVAAWWIARQVADGPSYWEVLDRLEVIDPGLVIDAKGRVDSLLESLTRSYGRAGEATAIGATIARDRDAFAAVGSALTTTTPARVSRYAEMLVDAGIDTQAAVQLAAAGRTGIAPDVGRVAAEIGRRAAEVADAFVALDAALQLERLRSLLDELEPGDRWQRWQHGGLVDDLRDAHRTAAHSALTRWPQLPVSEVVERFMASRSTAISHATMLAREAVEDTEAPRPEAVAVALRALRDAVRPR